VFVLGGSDQVEREVADDGHVLGAMTLAQPGLVVAEGDVEDPVQAVLDGSVPAHCLAGPFGIEVCRGDVGAGFRVQGAAPLDAGLDADDAGDAGQAQFAWEAALAGQPVHLAHEACGALLDAAMAFVVVGVDRDRAGQGCGEAGLAHPIQRAEVHSAS